MTVFVPQPTNSEVSPTLAAAHVASTSSVGNPASTPSDRDTQDHEGVRIPTSLATGTRVESADDSSTDSEGGVIVTPKSTGSTESLNLIASGTSTLLEDYKSDLNASRSRHVANGVAPFQSDQSGGAINSGGCDIAAKESHTGSTLTQSKQQLPVPETQSPTPVAGKPKSAVNSSPAAASSGPKHGSPLPRSLQDVFERARQANLDVFNLLHKYAARSSQHDEVGFLKSMDVQLAAGGMADVTVTKKTYKDHHGQAQITPYITGGQYKLLARALVRDRIAPKLPVWQLVHALEIAIAAREEVHAWFCALPATDVRVKDNAGHAAFIATLPEVRETILGHYNYITRYNDEDSDDDDY